MFRLTRSLLPCCLLLAALAGFGCDTAGSEPGVIIEDLIVGEGALAEDNMIVTVEYTGNLVNGPVFDTTEGREPLVFQLETGLLISDDPRRLTVIDGFTEGVPGMRVGGRRRLRIPPNLAYGRAGIPDVIPPDATLLFVIDLIDARLPEE